MNGSLSSFILYLTNGLVGLVLVLIGVIVRQHQKSDEEHRDKLGEEITRLRDRLHVAEGKLAGLEMLESSRHR